MPTAERARLEQLCRYLLRPPVAQDRLQLTGDGRGLLELKREWADLMRRGFDLDVLACPRCGGRMRLLATIEDPQGIRKILAHLGLPTEVLVLSPPRPPPTRAADLVADMPA